ncbi:MAG: murein hydrolase activator EnvC family protein [Clostridia bacterium]
MKRKIICVFLILALLQTITLNVFAVSQSDLNEAKDKLNAAKDSKKELTAEKDTILNEIAELEDTIDEYQAEIDALNKKISNTESNIEKKNEEIEKLQEEFEKKKKLLEDRLVAIYEEGRITFLDVLLASENIWDYISMSSKVQQLTEFDNEQMDIVEKQKEEVEKAKKELEDQKTELANQKNELKEKQTKIKVAKVNKEAKVSSLTAEQKKLQEEIDKYNKEVERIEEEIAKAAQDSDGKYGGNFSGVLSWPLPSNCTYISSYFGYRDQPVPGASTYHRAIDIGVSIGTPVYSAGNGYVMTKGYSSVRGYYVMVKHADNLYTFYQHLSSILVSQGQSVKRGQQIAKSGNTGIGSGPHLHFEVRTSPYYGSEVNPLNYVHW